MRNPVEKKTQKPFQSWICGGPVVRILSRIEEGRKKSSKCVVLHLHQHLVSKGAWVADSLGPFQPTLLATPFPLQPRRLFDFSSLRILIFSCVMKPRRSLARYGFSDSSQPPLSAMRAISPQNGGQRTKNPLFQRFRHEMISSRFRLSYVGSRKRLQHRSRGSARAPSFRNSFENNDLTDIYGTLKGNLLNIGMLQKNGGE